MAPWLQGVLTSLIIGVPSTLLGVLAYRQSRAAARDTVVLETRRQTAAESAADLTVFKDSIVELTGRVKRVEDDLDHEKVQRRLSNLFARTLVKVLRDNHLDVPALPEGLDLLDVS